MVGVLKQERNKTKKKVSSKHVECNGTRPKHKTIYEINVKHILHKLPLPLLLDGKCQEPQTIYGV